MRVIAGSYRSRPLAAPSGFLTRPTSDRMRETLFNVLAPRITGAAFADLYAGSGAVGIEALSRGAASVLFAETDRAALAALDANLRSLAISRGVRIERRDVVRVLDEAGGTPRGFDIVFLDPPWEPATEYARTIGFLARHAGALLRDGAVVIAEHRAKHPLADVYGDAAFEMRLVRTRALRQGDAALSFYSVALADEVEEAA